MKRGLFLFLFGTLIFALCFKFTALGFLLSSLAGIGGLIIVRYILKAIYKNRQKEVAGFTPTQESAVEAAKEGMEKLRAMSNKTRMINNNEVAGKIKEICKIGVRIFDDIKNNPNDLKRAKQFVLYYLDATKKIVDQYVELSGKKDITPEIEETLQKIEGMLDSIKETFNKQLVNLLEDDLMDINTEISVLKKTMKLEG